MDRSIVFLTLMGLVFVAGCKNKKDAPEEKSEAPASIRTLEMRGKAKKAPLDSPEECRKGCLVVGKCTLKDGKCIATSTESCRAAFGCKVGGLCEVRDGKCIAVNNRHCEQSDLCQSEGRCIAVDGRCENKNIVPEASAQPAGSAKAPGSSE